MKDINPGDEAPCPIQLPFATVGETLLLFADDGDTGSELWGERWDRGWDPPPARHPLQALKAQARTSGGLPPRFRRWGGQTSSSSPPTMVRAGGIQLWTSDGTPSGTTMASDIYPGARSSKPENLVLLPGNSLMSSYSTTPDELSPRR